MLKGKLYIKVWKICVGRVNLIFIRYRNIQEENKEEI